MHLSTSNSELSTASFNRASAYLATTLGLLYLCCELGTHYGFQRISRIQQRIHGEKMALLAVRPAAPGTPRNVAMVGNSLLLSSVDVPLLNQLGSGEFNYSRLVVEQTQYADWYFGLKRLFGEGAHPDAIVLVFGARHWLADTVRSEYFAHELMRPRDVFQLSHELDLDRTTAANYFFASFSAWLGGRAEMRKFILSHMLPDLQHFVGKLNPASPSYPAEEMIFSKVRERMVRLKTLCESHGVQLLTVLHPTLQARAPFDIFAKAAEAAALPLVLPVAKLAYPSALYADLYHLNAQGMERFTRDLVAPLESRLLGDYPPDNIRHTNEHAQNSTRP
jgi:hypothetical protein